jgi:hypothetical protein
VKLNMCFFVMIFNLQLNMCPASIPHIHKRCLFFFFLVRDEVVSMQKIHTGSGCKAFYFLD